MLIIKRSFYGNAARGTGGRLYPRILKKERGVENVHMKKERKTAVKYL